MTLMKRCEQIIVSDYVSCANKIDIVETDMITKVNCLFFCLWTIFSGVWLRKFLQKRRYAFGLMTIWSQKLPCQIQWRILKMPFLFQNIGKRCINHKSKLQMEFWINQEIDPFLELNDKSTPIWTSLNQLRKKCTNHIKS